MDYYELTMIVENEGEKEKEEYVNLSLHDFEELYGRETRNIGMLLLIKQKGFKDTRKLRMSSLYGEFGNLEDTKETIIIDSLDPKALVEKTCKETLDEFISAIGIYTDTDSVSKEKLEPRERTPEEKEKLNEIKEKLNGFYDKISVGEPVKDRLIRDAKKAKALQSNEQILKWCGDLTHPYDYRFASWEELSDQLKIAFESEDKYKHWCDQLINKINTNKIGGE